MKTFNDLSEAQQAVAVRNRLQFLMEMICDGTLKFNDPEIAAAVERAAQKAEDMKTPWFMHEYVMDEIGTQVTELAAAEARECLYAEPHEVVMPEPVLEN